MRLTLNKWSIDVALVDLRQRHVEAFSVAIQPASNDNYPATKYRAAVLRAAIEAGWFVEPGIKALDIPEMPAGAVRALADWLSEMFVAVNDPDPKE